MKPATLVVLILTLVPGCSRDGTLPLPAAPEPLPQVFARLWVVVIGNDTGGNCVDGATVEIVWGHDAGRRLTQGSGCATWDPDYDAVFDKLTLDVEQVLRASAPGYGASEKTVLTTNTGSVVFVLSKTP